MLDETLACHLGKEALDAAFDLDRRKRGKLPRKDGRAVEALSWTLTELLHPDDASAFQRNLLRVGARFLSDLQRELTGSAAKTTSDLHAFYSDECRNFVALLCGAGDVERAFRFCIALHRYTMSYRGQPRRFA